MKYRKIMFMLVLAIFIFGAASVCASDVNDTVIASEDTGQMELSAGNENGIVEQASNEEVISEANVGTFQELQENITRGYGSSYITLDKDYEYEDSFSADGITITQGNIIIDGQGHKIDAKGKARIFNIETDNVILNNITFMNGKSTDGGAIKWKANLGSVFDCRFENNTATGDGGAIHWENRGEAPGLNLNVIRGCSFVNNTPNYVERGGGAIYFTGGKYTATVEDCNFKDNSAPNGGAIYFEGGKYTATVEDCNFKDNSALNGGAVYFFEDYDTATVTNCNFTGNTASGNGGAINMASGTVSNCNFTNNTANRDGGAIRFSSTGTVSNCNFTNNKATGDDSYGGAILFAGTGNVTNCNFTNNSAGVGGAIWMSSGSVENCNFANNLAYDGGAIFSYQWYSTADTCIFKSESDTFNNNVVIVSPKLNVDNFTTFYGSCEKLTFNLTTDSGMPVTNGNISISVYFKDNNSWVGNYSCLSGEGWIPDLPVGSYYANFTTEYAGFQAINRTITITIPNVRYYINVTSITTNNKTVNITAKSDIPKDILWDGKLLFILPNGTQINATYGANGTWWAVHEFDKYDVYQVNATYVGLDNVTINNGTITINKVNSTISLDNIVLDYGESENVTVTTTGATGITAKIGESEANVTGFVISIPALDAGTYTLTVTTIPDDDYNPVTKEVNITVNKVNSTLTVGDMVFDYGSSGSIIVSVTGADGVNANVVGQPKAVVKVNGTNITVSDLDAGTYTLTVSAIGDKNHNNITKNATITVNKLKTELTGNAITTTYNVNKDLVITLKDITGKALSGVKVTVDLNGAKTYTTDKNGQVKVSTKGLAPKAYTAKVTFNGDTNYDKSTKDIKVTVKKATPKLTAKKKTFKTTPKTKKYTIVLKDNTGKAIKKAKVTLKVKGKTYKATTNSKGKATFKITKLNKKGTFKATITYKGNKYYNKVSKKAKIKVIVTFKTVSKGSKDKATVKEIQRALKNKGYYLTYQGHYLKVDGKFKGCTERSLKEFQKDNGLKVTGKVDEKTARKLGIL